MITIDIFYDKKLAYHQRRAIRNVTLEPTISGLLVKQFSWGNGADSMVKLSRSAGVTPELITSVIVYDDSETPTKKVHYYVTGFDWESQKTYILYLLINPWYQITRSKPCYIQRSNYIPSSALLKKPEPRLTFNQIKQGEILTGDVYGNGPWGILYLNRTDSPLSVELSSINYNISGTELPVAPDVPVQQPDGSMLAYYNDFNVINAPQPPNNISLGATYVYSQEEIALAGAPQLPTLSTRCYNVTNPTNIQPVVVPNVRVVFARQNTNGSWSGIITQPLNGFLVDYTGLIHDVIIPNGQLISVGTLIDNTTSATYPDIYTCRRNIAAWVTTQSNVYFSDYVIPTNVVGRNVAGNGYGTGGIVNGAFWANRTGAPTQDANINNGNWTATGGTFVTNIRDVIAGKNISGNGYNQATLPANTGGRTVQPTLTAGVYNDPSDANTYNFTFNQNITTGNVASGTISGKYSQFDTQWIALMGNPNYLLSVTSPQGILNSNVTAASVPLTFTNYTTLYYYQTSSRGTRVSTPVTTRRTFQGCNITASTVTFVNYDNSVVYDNQLLNKTFVDFNNPGSNYPWFIVNNKTLTSINNPGIPMPSSTGFTNNGLATEFTVNNVTYRYSPLDDVSGFYKVGQNIYQVISDRRTVNTIAQMNYTVTTQDIDANTYGMRGGTTPGTGNANVNLIVIGTGTPVIIDTVMDVQLDNTVLNNSIVISEPFAILAIPLFPVKYRLTSGGPLLTDPTLTTQKVFYDFIRSYSGTGQVADAQIIPYAPEIFKTAYRNDTDGVWIDLSELNTIGTQSTGDPMTSIPFVILDNTNINLSYFCNLHPYADPRKESTLRKYRVCSPNGDSVFEFRYYDFSNEVTDWGPEHNNADFRIDTSITLKPLGLYMRTLPYIRDNTLMGAKEFRDFRGTISGSAIFQSTMVSSAFETFRRQNVMYEQIQQRRVGTLELEQRVERQNEVVAAVTGGLQATYLGATAGRAMTEVMATVMGNGTNISGMIGGAIGGAAAGVGFGIAAGIQMKNNDDLRAREKADLEAYYEMNLATIRAQPDTINRVSTFNQDILRRFGVFIEIYGPTSEEAAYYDNYVKTFGHEIMIMDNLQNHLIDTCYVQGFLPYSDEPPHIHKRLNEDLEKGVYYFNEV